MPGTAAAE